MIKRFFYLLWLLPFVPVILLTAIRIAGAFAGCSTDAPSCILFGQDLGAIFENLLRNSLGILFTVYLVYFPILAIIGLLTERTFLRKVFVGAIAPVFALFCVFFMIIIADASTIHSRSDFDDLFWGIKTLPGSGILLIIPAVSNGTFFILWSLVMAAIAYFMTGQSGKDAKPAGWVKLYLFVLLFPIALLAYIAIFYLFLFIPCMIAGKSCFVSEDLVNLANMSLAVFLSSIMYCPALAAITALFSATSLKTRFQLGVILPSLCFVPFLTFQMRSELLYMLIFITVASVFALVLIALSLDYFERYKSKKAAA